MYKALVASVISAFLFFDASTNALQPATCSTDADCSYNGNCIPGGCACFDGWHGDKCGKIAFQAVDKSVIGYNRLPDSSASWGGSIVKDDAGVWHMWASELVNQCGLNSWGRNSAIVHATATEPEGPYTFKGRILGGSPMAFESRVTRAPTGEFVMFFSGKVNGSVIVNDGIVCDCSTGASNLGERSAIKWGWCPATGTTPGLSNQPTYMTWTNSPDDENSWSTPTELVEPVELGSAMDASFSPIIESDGSLKALWRTWVDCPTPQTKCSVIHTATATDWSNSGTYEYSQHNIFGGDKYELPQGVQDPFLWKDEDGVYHALFTYMIKDADKAEHFNSISHAYSRNFTGEAWTMTGTVFENKMPFSDGTSYTFPTCERPRLALEGTTIVALSMGCKSGGFGKERYLTVNSQYGNDWATFTPVIGLESQRIVKFLASFAVSCSSMAQYSSSIKTMLHRSGAFGEVSVKGSCIDSTISLDVAATYNTSAQAQAASVDLQTGPSAFFTRNGWTLNSAQAISQVRTDSPFADVNSSSDGGGTKSTSDEGGSGFGKALSLVIGICSMTLIAGLTAYSFCCGKGQKESDGSFIRRIQDGFDEQKGLLGSKRE